MHPETCPNCHADLKGPDIYERFLEMYEDEAQALVAAGMYGWSKETPKRFGRVIGLEYEGLYDGVSAWQCPDCGHKWDRDGFKDGVYCRRKD